MHKSVLTLLLFFLFTNLSGQIAEPVLKLSTAMHTASIYRFDANGQYLLTASTDKSAKLWDLYTGEFIKTFRIPIGEGNDGKLYAGAISPNGQLVALGGWTDDEYSIYIYDLTTGSMIKRFIEPKGTVHDLEFTPDGQYLAVAQCCGHGIQIYKINSKYDMYLYKTVDDHSKIVQNIVFDRNGRMAVATYDEQLQIYDSNFNLDKETTDVQGPIFSVAFSPDGTKIAVGYKNSAALEVRDAKSLKVLYKPSNYNASEKKQRINKLAFSPNGNYLLGLGYYDQRIAGKSRTGIRIWQFAGRGEYNDVWVGDGNTATDVKPLSDGSIAYVTTSPSFGRIKTDGTVIYEKMGELYSYRTADRSHLRVNEDGSQFTATSFDGYQYSFNVEERSFRTNVPLASYTVKKNGLEITNWQNYYAPNPEFNGTDSDVLKDGEICRSADISSTGFYASLGADWNLYLADKSGNKMWKTPAPGTVWANNITGNDKVIIAALGDGTIRWYALESGKNILSYYIHPNTKKWVLWTPSGYYDCSPGAEEYIGWHVNSGASEEAHFYPASKFRNKYYRPDVIDLVLSTRDEAEAIRMANMMNNRQHNETNIMDILPPVVKIVNPYNNYETTTEVVTVEYTAKSPNGEPITNMKFLIDGRPVENERGFVAVGSTQTKSITIPHKDVTIQVLAENQHGWSVPASIKVKYKGQVTPTANLLKPSLYVLSIGVSDYQKDEYDLKYAATDASDFANSIKNQEGGLYKKVEVRLLTDGNATKDDILDGLDWLQRSTTSRDLAMVFIAGHGVNDNYGTFYYLPNNADMENMRRTCLKFDELKYTASYCPGKVVMFVDACHSGDVMGGRRAAPDVNSLVNELSDVESGAVVFTSSTGKQFSLEDPSWGNGAFTEALLEGLSGKADLFGNGSITIKALDAYIAERVKQLTNGKQSPTVVIPQSMPDFAIGVTR